MTAPSFLDFFTDPVLRAPTIGSMLMCFSSSLIGVIVFLRKRSLLGEALSHAAYPGVVLSVILLSSFLPFSDEGLSIAVLIGAFLSALVGLFAIDFLEKRCRVKNDAALCFILSSFFGIGVLIASHIQVTHALWYKQIQLFLYGQTATMTDVHIGIYGTLSALVGIVLLFLYTLIQVTHFDRDFSKAVGVRVSFVDGALFILLVLAIVIGIRSVGVVLMSGMLIAPAATARQFTHRLSTLFWLSGFFGLVSAFLGCYFSLQIPVWMGAEKLFFPTGPMILLSAAALCLFALLFAPKRGVISRFVRIARFRAECRRENLLKSLWKAGEGTAVSLSEMTKWQKLPSFVLFLILVQLRFQGWLNRREDGLYLLTTSGFSRASRIVRLHRLWEVYLVTHLGQGVEKVHRNAEEMEHIITPELERELTELLRDPHKDPHHQPIPPRG